MLVAYAVTGNGTTKIGTIGLSRFQAGKRSMAFAVSSNLESDTVWSHHSVSVESTASSLQLTAWLNVSE